MTSIPPKGVVTPGYGAFFNSCYYVLMANTVKKYWFKRRRYGFGWTPVTWQGWITIGIYLFALLGYAFTMDEASPEGTIEDVYAYLGIVGGMTLCLIAITVIKGPRPKWRWGSKPTDDSSKDW